MASELVRAVGHSAAEQAKVDERLQALFEVGCAAWPGIDLEPRVFMRRVVDRSRGDDGALDEIHAADIYLACACSARHSAAIDAFYRTHLARVPEFLARMRPSPEFCEDVRQILSEKLLVGTSECPPKIDEYSGRGSLAAWLRVVALRTALNLRQQRSEEPEEAGAAVSRILATGISPELEYLRNRYAEQFGEALRAAFAALPSDQRLVLRLHLLKGLTGDQIAGTLQIHRATVVRWLGRAREELGREAARYLRARLQVTPSELESLVAVLRSQLDLRLSSLLDGPAG